MAADPVAEEQFGPYAVYERLGVGGMATVHRALERGHDGFERMVALKRLLPHLAEDASFIKSFVREAKLASLLSHINIVQIYELGRVGSEYFISMEYIDGRDVRRILRHARKVSGAPPIHVTVGLLIQLCEALDYAHNKVDENGEPLRLVHRDVSPSNVIVTSAGHLKVIDFGIAKAESSQLRTQTGRVKGKLAYMAPEAIAGGRDLDARSDLWAVGVILHELLTARPLFASKNEYQTLLKVQKGEIMPPSTFNQACPPELDAIVFKALARSPDDRFSSAADMRETLLEVKKQYSLQCGYRDVAAWLDWAFSLEQPGSAFTNQPTTGVSEVDPVERQVRAKTPRPARNADEEEAVAMVWGHGEGEGPDTGPLLLDDVPDVSAPRPAPPNLDDIPTPQPSHGARGVHADENLLTLATPEQALIPPPASPDPTIARGTDPPVARGSNQMRSSSPTGSQPKPRPARPTGSINVPKPAGTGAPIGRTTAQGIAAQRPPDASGPTRTGPSSTTPPTRASDRMPAQPARTTSPPPVADRTLAQRPTSPTRAGSPQPGRATSPPPDGASRPPGTRQTGPSPTVQPASTRKTGPSPTVRPASTRKTGPSPTVQPASTRQTGPSPVVPGTRASDRMPAQPTRASDRMPAQPTRASDRVPAQRPATDLSQLDVATSENLTTTTPEGFALPSIDSPALRAEDLFAEDDNNLAAADSAETVARPSSRKGTEFDVTTSPVAKALPEEVLPSVPVVRFSKQATVPPPVDGTRSTGTLSAVTRASTQSGAATGVPRTTGQLRAPTLGQTGPQRSKPLSQVGPAIIKRSSKRAYVFAALGVVVAAAAATAITMMSSKKGTTTHVTAPTTPGVTTEAPRSTSVAPNTPAGSAAAPTAPAAPDAKAPAAATTTPSTTKPATTKDPAPATTPSTTKPVAPETTKDPAAAPSTAKPTAPATAPATKATTPGPAGETTPSAPKTTAPVPAGATTPPATKTPAAAPAPAANATTARAKTTAPAPNPPAEAPATEPASEPTEPKPAP